MIPRDSDALRQCAAYGRPNVIFRIVIVVRRFLLIFPRLANGDPACLVFTGCHRDESLLNIFARRNTKASGACFASGFFITRSEGRFPRSWRWGSSAFRLQLCHDLALGVCTLGYTI